MRPFISNVLTNVKSPTGDLYSVDLGRHTLLLGPNRSGKTAIVQAVELGSVGAVDDLMGKSEVKMAATLLSLKPPQADHLRAAVEYSDGKKSGYYLERGSRAATDTARQNFMLHRITRSALSGSSAKLEEAMLHWCDVKGVSVNDIVSMLPEGTHAKYLDIAERMRRKHPEEARIAQAIAEYAGKEQRKLSAEIKALTKIQGAFSEQCSTIAATDAVANKIFELVGKATPPLVHLQKASRWAAESGVDQCPTCGSQVGNTHVKACAEHMEAQSPQEGGETLAPAVVVERIEKLMRDRIMWAQNLKYKRQIEQLEKDHDAYKLLKTSCSHAVGQIVAQMRGDFCSSVNRYLPADWSLLYCETQKTLGLCFGDDFIRTSLSGTEWVTAVTAIACAVGGTYDSEEALTLIVADRSWDSATLSGVMRGLSKFDGQVVMQGTTKPKGRTPKGWTIVETQQLFSPETPAKEVSSMTASMLTALNFTEDEVAEMSQQTVDEITEGGHPRAQVELLPGGSWRIL